MVEMDSTHIRRYVIENYKPLMGTYRGISASVAFWFAERSSLSSQAPKLDTCPSIVFILSLVFLRAFRNFMRASTIAGYLSQLLMLFVTECAG